MILKWGDYPHENGEVDLVSIAKTSTFSALGLPDKVTERWTYRGEVHGSSQAALTTAIAALENAYSSHNKDLIFYLDDGSTPTAHGIIAANTVDGTRVVSLTWEGGGSQYAPGVSTTGRKFLITVEAMFLDTIGILAWSETIVRSGGGEKWAYLQPLEGDPQRQRIYENTPYQVVQSGRAVGQAFWPDPPNPINIGAEHVDQRRSQYNSPTFAQNQNNNFEVSWTYQMESIDSIEGDPNSPV